MDAAAKLIDQQSTLRQQADQLWSSTNAKIDAAFSQTRDAINGYNDANRDVSFQSAVVGSQIDVLNNVAKYPTRDAFEQNKAQMSQDWQNTYGNRLKPFGDDFAQRKADLHWRPLLQKWKTWLSPNSKKGKSAEAERLLLGVTDPRAVPSVWSVFAAGRDPAQQARAVEMLGRIDSPVA